MDATFFPCTDCGELLKLYPGLAKVGDKIICPVCEAEVVVPPGDKSVASDTPTVVRQRVDPSAVRPTVEPPPRRPLQTPRFSPVLVCARWLVRHRRAVVRVLVPLLVIVILAVTRMLLVRAAVGRVDRLIASISERATVSYAGIQVSSLGRQLRLTDVRIKPREKPRLISIDRIEARYSGWGEAIPHKLHVEALGLHIPLYPETMGAFGPAMKKLEYYSLPIHLTVAYEYEVESKTLVVDTCELICAGVADVRATAKISGVDFQEDRLASDQVLEMFKRWHIDEAFLEYCDDSLVARFLDYQAKYIGESSTELQQGMLADLDQVIAAEWDADTKATLLTFREFLQNSRYVAIASAPLAPVAVADVIDVYRQQGLKGLIPVLEMKLSANCPYADRPDTDWVPVEPPS